MIAESTLSRKLGIQSPLLIYTPRPDIRTQVEFAAVTEPRLPSLWRGLATVRYKVWRGLFPRISTSDSLAITVTAFAGLRGKRVVDPPGLDKGDLAWGAVS